MPPCKFSLITSPSFTYKRPRCPLKALKRFLRRNSRRITHIIAKSIISGAFVAVGIVAGLTIVGLICFITGICLASCQEDTQTPEEYRQSVIEHFEARGQTPPRWTQKEGGRDV